MKIAVSQGVHRTFSDRDVDNRTLKVSLEALAESVATLSGIPRLCLVQGLGGGKYVLDGLGWIKKAVEKAFRQPAGHLWTEKGIREGHGMGCTWGWSLVKGLGRDPMSSSSQETAFQRGGGGCQVDSCRFIAVPLKADCPFSMHDLA